MLKLVSELLQGFLFIFGLLKYYSAGFANCKTEAYSLYWPMLLVVWCGVYKLLRLALIILFLVIICIVYCVCGRRT